MKRSLTFILMLGGVMLGALSGCEKEKSATEPVYNPISRLDAEVLLKQWNAERKGRLKSATTLNLTEEQWGRAKVTVHPESLLSNMSIPLGDGLTLSLGKKGDTTSLHLLCVCPLPSYLAATGGALSEKTYTGYILVYNRRSEALFALRYQNGIFKAAHEVGFEKSLLKADIPELVIYGQRRTPLHVVYIEMGPAGGGSTADFLEYAQVSSFRVGGGGGRSLGINTKPKLPDLDTDPDPKPEVDTSDASFRNTKAACVLAKLLGKTNTTMYDPSTVVGKLLKDYWGKTAAGAHNLTFVVSPSSKLKNPSANAECVTNGTRNVVIRINSSYMESCSNVELARTIIHESIHAELYVRINGLGAGVSSDADFVSLFEKYKEFGNQRDHNIMAESDYVNLIAQGLKAYHDAGYMAEFDSRIPDAYLGDFDYQKFYSMMAWIGLHESKQYVLNKQQVEWYAEYKKYTSAARTNDNTKCN